ncbi:MAG: hypothetical protein JWP12_1968 [Bacteroidetes bacterium]|nr:hypothetical protein [Bacteroidota bacterium]
MKKILFFFASFCAFLMLSSCDDFQDVTFSGIESVKIIKMSQQGVEAEISVKIKNPNNTAFHIYPSDMALTLNGTNAGKALLTNNIKIKAGSEEVYVFKMKSDFTELDPAALSQLIVMAMSRNALIGLKGDVKVGKFLVHKKFPIEFSKNVPIGNFTGQ